MKTLWTIVRSPLVLSALRLSIGLGIVVLLFWYVGFKHIVEVFFNLRWPYIAVLLALSVVLIWVSCLKWQLFIKSAGHEVSLLLLMRYYTQSYFFSMFMPSIIGGDVARSYQLGKQIGTYKSVFAATFIERFTGFLAMNLVGLVFVFLGAEATDGVELALIAVSTTTIALAVVLFSQTLSSSGFSLGLSALRLLGLTKLSIKLESVVPKIQESVEFARNDLQLFAKAMALAFLFHFLAAINTYIAALAVGWTDVSLGSMCIVVPLVLLVSVAPVTPSSVGVQEGAFLYFLTRVGATHPQALAVGVVLRAKNLLTALVGGLLVLRTKR